MKKTNVIAVAATLLFSSGAHLALADLVTITGPTNIVIPEDGADHTFDYVLTNNSGALISISSANSSISTAISGDHTDAPLISNSVIGCVGLTLQNMGTCTLLEFTLTPDNGSGETDADFAGGEFSMSAFISNTADTVSLNGTIITTDPGFAAPEPATLGLLGLGLFGLAVARRRSR